MDLQPGSACQRLCPRLQSSRPRAGLSGPTLVGEPGLSVVSTFVSYVAELTTEGWKRDCFICQCLCPLLASSRPKNGPVQHVNICVCRAHERGLEAAIV